MLRLSFLTRQLAYDLDTNLLVRPATLLGLHVLAALTLPSLEAALVGRVPALAELSAWIALEPGTAQLLMATVAGAVMTVISVVYSILLVALSLASIQFSTRILAGFMRDRVSRNVLGLFVGTFAYCLGLIRAIHTTPPVVPTFSVLGGLVLALVSLASLVLFIHHIVRSIQANVLVDRIATEAEAVIDTVFVETGPAAGRDMRLDGHAHGATPDLPPLPHHILATHSGYIQLVDTNGLLLLADGRALSVLRPMGAFVARGVPLLASDRPVPPQLAAALLGRVDIGPDRTTQEDVEFGFRQIVDIALKAISPAVNDPSTAATCVDHLGRLLLRVASRPPPRTFFAAGASRLHVPNTCFGDLLDLSVEQIRQYGRTDMATCLRLVRVLTEVAPHVRHPAELRRLARHVSAVMHGAEGAFAPEDTEELRRRYTLFQEAMERGEDGV